MSLTYRFIVNPHEESPVLEWFRATPNVPNEIAVNEGTILNFVNCGQLAYRDDGKIDPKLSPIATLIHPKVKRGILWTVGEIHFLATPLCQRFPELAKINLEFRKWLALLDCVFDAKRSDNEFDYYLEGSVRNFDPPIYAFASGLAALKRGQYFIGDSDNDVRIATICRTLSLRGIECTA